MSEPETSTDRSKRLCLLIAASRQKGQWATASGLQTSGPGGVEWSINCPDHTRHDLSELAWFLLKLTKEGLLLRSERGWLLSEKGSEYLQSEGLLRC